MCHWRLLTVYTEANEDKFGDLINFQKRIMISKVIEGTTDRRKPDLIRV